jgi:endoglucanase
MGKGQIHFVTTDLMTDPDAENCSDCFNDFGIDLVLTPEWQRYTVLFSQMKQRPGWGDRAEHVGQQLLAFEWLCETAGQAYEIQIDNVALVGCAE